MNKATILIVDDTPENLDVLRGILESLYNLIIATNGEKALTICNREDKPDLILLDIMMPGIDGYEVCQQLKSNDLTKDIPIIFVTAKNEVADESRGFELGAVDYITKPVSASIVLKRVESHLRLYDVNRFLSEKVAHQTQELQQLTSKLLYVQEEERKHIARELHDDLSQRMAALSIQAGNLELDPRAVDLKTSISTLREGLIDLATDIHGLSRRLHPSILDDLGLEEALRSEIDRFIDSEGVPVEFIISKSFPKLENDTQLCLFRIVQESLRNISKYSAASEVTVTLSEDGGEIIMSIQDNGMGFDVPRALKSPGLGLQSMKERAKLIQAELHIRSIINQGTRIELRRKKMAS